MRQESYEDIADFFVIMNIEGSEIKNYAKRANTNNS